MGARRGTVVAGQCGGLAAVGVDGPGASAWGECIYANEDGGALLGAAWESDYSEYCNHTAYVITGGQVPAGCLANGSDLSQVLPRVDAGCAPDAAADAGSD